MVLGQCPFHLRVDGVRGNRSRDRLDGVEVATCGLIDAVDATSFLRRRRGGHTPCRDAIDATGRRLTLTSERRAPAMTVLTYKGPPSARKEAQKELASLYTNDAGRRRRGGVAAAAAAREASKLANISSGLGGNLLRNWGNYYDRSKLTSATNFNTEIDNLATQYFADLQGFDAEADNRVNQNQPISQPSPFVMLADVGMTTAEYLQNTSEDRVLDGARNPA